MSLGPRLRFAREKSGLTIAQASIRSSVGESSISEFENAKREPRMSHLSALAETYQRPISFFLADGIPEAEATVLWRKAPTEPVGLAIETEFKRLCQQYRNLEVWCNEATASSLPRFESRSEMFTYADAKELAHSVWKALSLGDQPGSGLLRVLEEIYGVKVFFRDFEPAGTAASVVSEDFGTAILLNSKNVPWRRTFDIAHELFHIITWDYFKNAKINETSRPAASEESYANCFASHLLMPSDATKNAIDRMLSSGKLSFDDLSDVARRFEVSVEALLWRMHWLYNRTEEQTRSDIDRARVLAPPPVPDNCTAPPKFPVRYVALAMKALKRGEISVGRYAGYLEIAREEAIKHLSTEAVGDDDKVEVTVS